MIRSSSLSWPAKLSDVFPPEAIRVGLAQHSKSSIIVELVRHATSKSSAAFTALKDTWPYVAKSKTA
jgi:hypothetical protein